jgi:hypothetical protein
VSVHGRSGDFSDGQLEAAEAGLAHIRESLLAAARGDSDATDLRDSLLGYLEQHGPVLRSAAATVGEEVRRQLLEHLYGWRAQLDAQLGGRRRPPPE